LTLFYRTRRYTSIPKFEETVTTSGSTTKRSHYYLAGQLIAVRVVTGSSSNLYYAFADHLGNVSAWTNASGVYVTNSSARYEPYGGYRTQPVATVNPGITDRGFTGHRSNDTGTCLYLLGLTHLHRIHANEHEIRTIFAPEIRAIRAAKLRQFVAKNSYLRKSSLLQKRIRLPLTADRRCRPMP
jgi:hypothetical protein